MTVTDCSLNLPNDPEARGHLKQRLGDISSFMLCGAQIKTVLMTDGHLQQGITRNCISPSFSKTVCIEANVK